MKKYRKNIKGITLISLIITIIVLLILTSVTIYSGKSVIQNSKFNTFSTELKMMQTNINDIYDKYKSGETVNGLQGDDILTSLGKDISSNAEVSAQATRVFTSGESGITDKTGYRFFDTQTLADLNIEGIEQEFFVNIAKRSIISYYGFEYDGETYYTVDQLTNNLYNVEYEENTNKPTFDVNYEDTENDRIKVTISNIQYNGYIDKWIVKYKKEGQNYWDTSENLEFNITEQGNYIFVIENGNVASEEKNVTINTNAVVGERVEETRKDNYTDTEGNKATIPAGFAVSGIPEEQLISKGLVIYEIPEGTEEINWLEKDTDGTYKVQKQYNQFVWIPVDGGNIKLEYSSISDKYTGSQTDYTENTEETPYEKYITSAKGYYIGRYETGIGTNGIPTIIRGANPNITDWDTAKSKAESMYTETDGYTSRMMTNKTWDTVINCMVHYGLSESEVLDSRNWGGYISDGQSLKTGSSDKYEKFNVYDFAGNKSEWTADIYKNDNSCRAIRDYWTGGSYVTYFQVLYHRYNTKSVSNSYGYRIQLYITK